MGVQYQGASAVARNDARFSSNSTTSTTPPNARREPDVILKPSHEGVDFTLRLLAANRMAKVVEWHCGDDATAAKHELSDDDIDALFGAMGSRRHSDESDDDDEKKGNDDNGDDGYVVTENYQGPADDHMIQAGGLPYLESLSIIGSSNNSSEKNISTDETDATATPSFIAGLTSFLASSQSFPRFTSLTLQGVNLRGTALELRALTEVFRLHPRIRRVQMTACWFSEEQQADMAALQQVFCQQQEQAQRCSVFGGDFLSDGPRRQQQLLFQSQRATLPDAMNPRPSATARAVPTATTATTNTAVSTSEVYNHNTSHNDNSTANANANTTDSWWGERLLKSCFCWW